MQHVRMHVVENDWFLNVLT